MIICPSGVLTLSGKMSVWGGHNVVFQNRNEYVASGGGGWAGNFKNRPGRCGFTTFTSAAHT